MWFEKYNACYMDEAGGDGSDGGGSGGIDTSSVEFANALAAAVANETAGLKTKNAEILDKLKTSSAQAKQWEGYDLEDVKSTMQLFSQSEEAQLLKEGKFDEVVAKRTDKLTADFNDRLTSMSTDLQTAAAEGDKYKALYQSMTIDHAIRDVAAKDLARPEALDDIVRRATDIFNINSKGELEARDREGNLLKGSDDYLISPERFVKALKGTHPHYWPESTSGGAGGSTGGRNGSSDLTAKMEEAASKGDMKAYREIRDKARKVASK